MNTAPGVAAEPIGRFHVWQRGNALPTIPQVSELSIMPVDDSELAAELTGIDEAETEHRLAHGHHLWIARADGEPVGWGWCATESFSIGELGIARTLPTTDRYLWDFFTVPSWRGHRIYPSLLQAIITREREAERFWLGHDLGNEASRRGIARAGFQEVGALYREQGEEFILIPANALELALAAGQLFAVSVARPSLPQSNCHQTMIPGFESSVGRSSTEGIMAETEAATARKQWDAMNPASKENLLRVVREEADRMLELAEVPANWESSTPCGHWQVRDIVAHMVDVTEGYLEAFRIARASESAPPPIGLLTMAETLDEHALAFRSVPQQELLQRLRDDFDEMMAIFEELTPEEWTGLLVPHPFMGPVPAFFYPTFHLVDYGVHGWDVREGLGLPNGLSGDVADFLAPIMFILWQATTVPDRIGSEPIRAGVRVSGRNGGTWRITVNDAGYAYEQIAGDGADLPVIFDFDPGSLVLTAYGRIHAGTAYGDPDVANRYRGLFHSI